MNYARRLIEVDLPNKRISTHARREKSIRHGHMQGRSLRRPLARPGRSALPPGVPGLRHSRHHRIRP